jgi:hypothetical protein
MELQYGDIVLRQTLQEFFALQKRALRYTAGLKIWNRARKALEI